MILNKVTFLNFCAFVLFQFIATQAKAQEVVSTQIAPAASEEELCTVPPIYFSSDKLMPTGHIKVVAQETEINGTSNASFKGSVDIVNDSAVISAQEALVTNNPLSLYASGNVGYQDEQVLVKSESIELDSTQGSVSMDQTIYQLTGFVGHGAAETIDLNKNEGLSLKNVSFTTCPYGQEDWSLKASEISIAKGAYLGEAKNTRFYLGDVPILYLPYFAFPVSTKRQTGLLYPAVSTSSSTGIDFQQPFYWNLAPNYDMLITPRLMINRGAQLQAEFRYITNNSKGQINTEYLPNDQSETGKPDRYFYRIFHQATLSSNWQLEANINGLSDDNYIVDLGSNFYNRADTYLYRTLGVNYYSDNLDFNLFLRDFETIGDHSDVYHALPEAKLDYNLPLGNYFNFNLNSEFAYFESGSADNPTAVRWHVEPTISVPYQRYWGEVTGELSLLQTFYEQELPSNSELKKSVSRTLSQGRLYGALYFEKPQTWFNKSATMTLEPKVQYLYTSYEDQSNIGLYDTTALLVDVEGLFRGREFTGLDRISDNNQVTLGVTSRIIDEYNREQFLLSVGQIFYLSANKVQLASKPTDRSALAGELDWRLNNRLFVHSEVQITTETDKVERSSVTFEYRDSNDSLIQLTHRYVRDLSGEIIDQAGISASWPISNTWHIVGRSYRDLERHRSIENYIGIQYESCCVAIRLTWQRELTNRYDDNLLSTGDFDSGISLDFIFKGISTKSSDIDMLKDGMFGYRQPYNLN